MASKVLDARTGKWLQEGDEVSAGGTLHYMDPSTKQMRTVEQPPHRILILKINDWFLWASADIEQWYPEPSSTKENPRIIHEHRRVPLMVRFLHPSFLFKRVLFLPT